MHFRFAQKATLGYQDANPSLSAICFLMHRSKQHRYSITPSARASRIGGLSRGTRGTERYGTSERAPDHCGLMPANLITLVHLSIFSAMNLANSSGEFGRTATAPRSANRCLMFGSSTAALVC